MQRELISVVLCGLLAGPVLAEPGKEAWKGDMEERLDRLEKRLFEQEEEIRAKEQQIERLEATEGSDEKVGGKDWYRQLELGGLVEIEASHLSSDNQPDSSDLILSTLELGLITQLNEWVGAEILLLYEEDTDNNGDLNVDVATVTISDPGSDWFLRLGQNTLPFGVYPTYMVSDPVTLDLGETNDTAIEAGLQRAGLSASLFLFQGEHNRRLDNFGAQLGYASDSGGPGYRGNLAYLDNLAESDTLVDAGWITTSEKMSAWILSVELFSGPFSLIGEYLRTTRGFSDAAGEQPSAFNLEAAYRFQLLEREMILAVGHQHTSDAADANWELPENRLLGTLKVDLIEGVDTRIEVRRDEDYAGERSLTATAQLAVEF